MKQSRFVTLMTFAGLAVLALVIGGCQESQGTSSPLEPTGVPVALEKRGPIVPAILEVPSGHRVFEHLYARGVQIYQCTQTATGFAWTFVAPEATLYSNECFRGQVGTHYAGPTWESNSGSKVVATVEQPSPSPDPNAIPWLRLKKVSTSGHGLFERTTYILRVNTSGGKAPATGADAEHLGQIVRIPYTAEYYFYRAQH